MVKMSLKNRSPKKIERIERQLSLCKNTFYLTDVTVISKAYCWIKSPFLVFSELWLADSTQLFWLKRLSKVTNSNGILSASHWIALIGKAASWIPQAELYWLHRNWMQLNSSAFSWTAPNFTQLNNTVCLNSIELYSLNCPHPCLSCSP